MKKVTRKIAMGGRILVKIFAVLVMVATSATTLFGSTLYVTPTGAGNKDGSSWANAFAGIQAAVDYVDAAVAADANYPIPTIHVADVHRLHAPKRRRHWQ